MKAHGLARIGRDAEVRQTQGGQSVVNLSLAFTWGQKGEDGKRPTEWVSASFWGQRAEKLAPYLTKGAQIVAYLEDLHIEKFNGQNGEQVKLSAKCVDVELVSNGQQQSTQQAAQQRQAPPPRPAPRPAPPQTDAFEDDIPF